MKAQFDCLCNHRPELINLNEDYNEFCDSLRLIEQDERANLYQCAECSQYWRVDIQGFCNVVYALKIDSEKEWRKHDAGDIIKANMLRVRAGFGEDICKKENCHEHVINGSTLCLEHLYQSGARM